MNIFSICDTVCTTDQYGNMLIGKIISEGNNFSDIKVVYCAMAGPFFNCFFTKHISNLSIPTESQIMLYQMEH
jgi:hypothetical protein